MKLRGFFWAHSYQGFAQMKTIFHKEAKFSIGIRSFSIYCSTCTLQENLDRNRLFTKKNFKDDPLNFSLCRRINVPKNSKNNLGYRGWNGGVSVFIFNIVIHVILLYCKRKHFAQRSMLEYNDFGRS